MGRHATKEAFLILTPLEGGGGGIEEPLKGEAAAEREGTGEAEEEGEEPEDEAAAALNDV